MNGVMVPNDKQEIEMFGETFESVSQIAHTLLGTLVVVLMAYLFDHPFIGCGMIFAWASFKEFYYDAFYEEPTISGGLIGSLRDFGFYNLGSAIGMGIWGLKTIIS